VKGFRFRRSYVTLYGAILDRPQELRAVTLERAKLLARCVLGIDVALVSEIGVQLGVLSLPSLEFRST